MRFSGDGLPQVLGLSGLGALAIGVADFIAWKNLGVPVSAFLPYTLATGMEVGAGLVGYFIKKTEGDLETTIEKEPLPVQTRKAGLFAGVMNASSVALTGVMLQQPLEPVVPFTGGLAVVASRLGMKIFQGKNANEDDMNMAQKAVNLGTVATNAALLLQEKALIAEKLSLAEHGEIALNSIGIGLLAVVSPYISRFVSEYSVRIEASKAEKVVENQVGAMVLGDKIINQFDLNQEPTDLNKSVDEILEYINKVINPNREDIKEMLDTYRTMHTEFEFQPYAMAAVNKVLDHERYIEQVRNSVGYNNEVAPSVGIYFGDLLIQISENLMRKRILKLAQKGQAEMARKERRRAENP